MLVLHPTLLDYAPPVWIISPSRQFATVHSSSLAMTDPIGERLQVFDPKRDFTVVERSLPHWSQTGVISFITWRTWDSIPRHVLESWLAERANWLRRLNIDPDSDDWATKLELISAELRHDFQMHLSDRWNEQLDACHGACVLKRPELSRIVADSILHFDGDRYDMTDFVVMPNHVHVLAAFPDDTSMLRQCDSWKHFTATQLNRRLSRSGRFWQQDGFDHLVRSIDQFEHLRRYIADNPRRAKLRPSEYFHVSKPL